MSNLFHDTLQCLKNVIKVCKVARKYPQIFLILMRKWGTDEASGVKKHLKLRTIVRVLAKDIFKFQRFRGLSR